MKRVIGVFFAVFLFVGAGCNASYNMTPDAPEQSADLVSQHRAACSKIDKNYFPVMGTYISTCLTNAQSAVMASSHAEIGGDGTASVSAVEDEDNHARIFASTLQHKAIGDEVQICFDCLKPTSSIEELRTALNFTPQDTITKTEVGGKFAVKALFDEAVIYLIPQAYTNYNVYIHGDGATGAAEANEMAKNIWFDVKAER